MRRLKVVLLLRVSTRVRLTRPIRSGKNTMARLLQNQINIQWNKQDLLLLLCSALKVLRVLVLVHQQGVLFLQLLCMTSHPGIRGGPAERAAAEERERQPHQAEQEAEHLRQKMQEEHLRQKMQEEAEQRRQEALSAAEELKKKVRSCLHHREPTCNNLTTRVAGQSETAHSAASRRSRRTRTSCARG